MSDEPKPHPPVEDQEQHVDRSVLIGMGGRWVTDWALRLAILLVAGWLVSRIGGALWVGILPILLALIISTVLWPPTGWMVRHKVPKTLAALLSIVGSLGLLTGVIALIAPSIVQQSVQLADQTSEAIGEVQDWLRGPPLNIRDEQLDGVLDQLSSTLQDRGDQIASGVFSGVSAVGSLLVTLVLVLVLTFFFIKDGPRFLPFVRRNTGRTAGRHLTEVLTRAWNTLGGYIRAQAIVSFVDAVLIGLALVILGVPLAWALAVITFIAGFIPIVGAFTAGFVAVVVALVANGLTTAILALVLIIVVQQVEGNILSPVLQSKAMNLHAAIVLLSVTLGSTIFGIIGAFLAVPVAAVVAVWFRYLGDLTDLRTGDKTAADIKFATEAGTVTGVQEEAAGRALRERLATLRFGHDADKEASAQTAGELEEEVGAVATARPASGRNKSDGEGNGASGNGNGNHRGDGADHGPFGGRGRTVGNMLNKVTGTITGCFRRR